MIILLQGPEGAGKTCLMTGLAKGLHDSLGMDILAFPGYEVHTPRGKVISKELPIEQWASMPEELNNVVICIDEPENQFPMTWNSPIVRIFRGVLAQRRKRNLQVIFPGQFCDYLPKPISKLVHMVGDCWEMHFAPVEDDFVRPPRGIYTRARFCDLKGFYTGYPGTWGPQVIFHARKLWDWYDTNQKVDVFNAWDKLKVKGREYELDLRGGGTDENDGDPHKLPPMPLDIRNGDGQLKDPDEMVTEMLAARYSPADIFKIQKIMSKSR